MYFEALTFHMLVLNFSASLLLPLVLGTLSFRLRDADIDRTTAGVLRWVGWAYGFKWCCALVVRHLPIPLLSKRLVNRRFSVAAATVRKQ